MGIRSSPPDYDDAKRSILERVRTETMTSPERVGALIDAVRHVQRHGIPGDIVECGVWRGGSSMAAALTVQESLGPERNLYLYDTFDGMSSPTDADKDALGRSASALLRQENKRTSSTWACCPRDQVEMNLRTTGYPLNRIHFIVGKVEETIPQTMPDCISVLRLDTDWYESTKHELIHLYPRLSVGGILIIDDYGHWMGARKAVDEYFAEKDIPIFLSRVDYTGRIAIKPPSRNP